MPDPVPPIGLSYLASAMRRAQHDCDIFDLTFQLKFEEKLKARILERRPEVIDKLRKEGLLTDEELRTLEELESEIRGKKNR
jgi:phage portal protein BeeE